MPSPIDRLTPDSPPEEVQAAIQETIQLLIQEGRDPQQAEAIALAMAERAMGQALSRQKPKAIDMRSAEMNQRAVDEYMSQMPPMSGMSKGY